VGGTNTCNGWEVEGSKQNGQVQGNYDASCTLTSLLVSNLQNFKRMFLLRRVCLHFLYNAPVVRNAALYKFCGHPCAYFSSVGDIRYFLRGCLYKRNMFCVYQFSRRVVWDEQKMADGQMATKDINMCSWRSSVSGECMVFCTEVGNQHARGGGIVVQQWKPAVSQQWGPRSLLEHTAAQQ
jgi:hypothetical protein